MSNGTACAIRGGTRAGPVLPRGHRHDSGSECWPDRYRQCSPVVLITIHIPFLLPPFAFARVQILCWLIIFASRLLYKFPRCRLRHLGDQQSGGTKRDLSHCEFNSHYCPSREAPSDDRNWNALDNRLRAGSNVLPKLLLLRHRHQTRTTRNQ